MGKAGPRTLVLDAGALIAFERGDSRMRALVREALSLAARIIVPAGALGQVWRQPARQVRLGALLNGPTSSVLPLDQPLAEASGILCGRSETSDVIDASVVLTARRVNGVILTGDSGDLRRLDATVPLERI